MVVQKPWAGGYRAPAAERRTWSRSVPGAGTQNEDPPKIVFFNGWSRLQRCFLWFHFRETSQHVAVHRIGRSKDILACSSRELAPFSGTISTYLHHQVHGSQLQLLQLSHREAHVVLWARTLIHFAHPAGNLLVRVETVDRHLGGAKGPSW